jgi:hypothetical protein
MCRNNVFVTIETFLHRGNSWISGAVHVGMTKLTLDLLHPGVNPMAERDGLCRANILYRRKVELIKESQYEKYAASHQEQWAPVHFYSCEEFLN